MRFFKNFYLLKDLFGKYLNVRFSINPSIYFSSRFCTVWNAFSLKKVPISDGNTHGHHRECPAPSGPHSHWRLSSNITGSGLGSPGILFSAIHFVIPFMFFFRFTYAKKRTERAVSFQHLWERKTVISFASGLFFLQIMRGRGHPLKAQQTSVELFRV